VVEAWKLY